LICLDGSFYGWLKHFMKDGDGIGVIFWWSLEVHVQKLAQSKSNTENWRYQKINKLKVSPLFPPLLKQSIKHKTHINFIKFTTNATNK
jgi:hypothetical protein